MSYLIIHIVDLDQLLTAIVLVWIKRKIKQLNILKQAAKKNKK